MKFMHQLLRNFCLIASVACAANALAQQKQHDTEYKTVDERVNATAKKLAEYVRQKRKKMKGMYTIYDLAKGKCAVINDGNIRELRKVLRAAFPDDHAHICGSCKYYKASSKHAGEWEGVGEGNNLQMPAQSVKDFIVMNSEYRVWASNLRSGEEVIIDGHKRIFLEYIPGSYTPIVYVNPEYEKAFRCGKPFLISLAEYARPVPEIIKVTIDEIAKWKGVNVDQIEIVP